MAAPMSSTETMSLEELCASDIFDGEMLLPSAPRFKNAAKQWNAVFDNKCPCAIVYCNNTHDVSVLVKWIAAKPSERRFSVRSSGHCWNGKF
jgi:hypothetical protein